MKKKVLIVEDQILIADTIARYLQTQDYYIAGVAISYLEAVQLFQETSPDIVLIDIHLNGKETGIDFARFLSTELNPTPFIFLTAQLDKEHIENAKQTQPAGYLPKPIRIETLLTTVEIALHNHEELQKQKVFIRINDGDTKHLINVETILYLHADHVYVEIQLTDDRQIITRSSLRDLLNFLPAKTFVQTHRSYVVNTKHVKSWDNQTIHFPSISVPISRSYGKEVIQKLNTLAIQNK